MCCDTLFVTLRPHPHWQCQTVEQCKPLLEELQKELTQLDATVWLKEDLALAAGDLFIHLMCWTKSFCGCSYSSGSGGEGGAPQGGARCAPNMVVESTMP